MNQKCIDQLNKLKEASPLEMTQILQDMEMYDAKSSQEIIDEVYKQFESGENIKDEVLKPVFMSVIDGLLKATSVGSKASKKGLTASRVFEECENFSYDNDIESNNNLNVENKKNELKRESYNLEQNQKDGSPNIEQNYVRKNYEDKKAMNHYKQERVIGEKTLVDEYTGKKNLYLKKDNPNKHYNDKTYRKQAQPDHIIPLKEIYDKLKSNYALDDYDIKRISNIDDNFAVTSAEINQAKKQMTNKKYLNENNVKDKKTRKNMINLQNSSEKACGSMTNKTVLNNLCGNTYVDDKSVKLEIRKFRKEHAGENPDKQQIEKIKKNLCKEKSKRIRKTASEKITSNAKKDAMSQTKDYAIGNIILLIVKPLYYEMTDIFKNGFKEGVHADTGTDAIKIRFGRIKKYVFNHIKGFLGDNVLEFVKGFISSLVEGIISMFVGIFRQVLKIVKEGFKIFIQSTKVLFGKNSEEMSPAQKGDAIIKIIGGSIIAIAGIGIETLINKLPISAKWSTVISVILSGVASAAFMYIIDKIDIFSVKAEKRHDRIIEIFDERIKDIKEASETCNVIALDTLRNQREQYEKINSQIDEGINKNNIETINEGLYKIANFMSIDLGYSNSEEFCNFMDSEDTLTL